MVNKKTSSKKQVSGVADEILEQQEQTERSMKSLTDLLESEENSQSGTRKAIDTLHPADEEKIDRLTILTPQEVAAHAIVEWQIKALKMRGLNKKFVAEGLSDKLKALKVSQQGRGRNEIGELFRPEILGQMLQQGLIPSGMIGSSASIGSERRPFWKRVMGMR